MFPSVKEVNRLKGVEDILCYWDVSVSRSNSWVTRPLKVKGVCSVRDSLDVCSGSAECCGLSLIWLGVRGDTELQAPVLANVSARSSLGFREQWRSWKMEQLETSRVGWCSVASAVSTNACQGHVAIRRADLHPGRGGAGRHDHVWQETKTGCTSGWAWPD